MMTVNEVSKLTGVSIRTLQYYDTIGLLKPIEYTESGYRLYDDTSLERLQQILLFKELEFPLKEIKKIIDAPNFDRNKALEQQIELLTMKKEHLENLISFARGIKGIGVKYMDFKVFDTTKIDEYSKRAKEQWGQTSEYKEFEEKTKNWTKDDEATVANGFMQLFVEFGQMKEMDPADEQGHAILDLSVYDAKRAGFKKVVFIIKHAIEKDFREIVGKRIEPFMEVEYVFQELDKLPEGYQVPEGREKPFGTGHAILSCINEVDAPFAVINADDYYGREAFQLIYDYLNSHEDDDKFRYTMVGYKLCNTVTENGYVSRGVCEMNEAGELIGIRERTRIEHHENGIAFTEDDGATWTHLDDDTTVSMNMWGFSKSILDEIEKGFPAFLEKGLKENPMKCEYYLPGVVSDLLGENRATVAVLKSADKWYGVTYKEDKPVVMEAIRKMEEEGLYPA